MLASRPVWIGRWVSVSCSWWEALWDGEMEARGAVSSMQNAGRELQPEQEPFSLISRGAWLCLSPSLTLTDATQPTCWTLHFPVQLFCSVGFFPFDSKSSRGGEFENFSGARCVCVCGAVCTWRLCLLPLWTALPPTLSLLTHPFPRILWAPAFLGAAVTSCGRGFVFSG